MQATIKRVRDGSGGQYYKSGFHVFLDKQQAVDALGDFSANRQLVVVECLAEGLRSKQFSRRDVYLADRIYINE